MLEKRYRGKDGNTSNRRDRLIIIDSSLLMYAIKGKKRMPINIELALKEVSEGARLVVLDTTIEELEILRNRKKGKIKIAADFALELIRRMQIEIITVDKAIIEELARIKNRLKFYEYYDEIIARMAGKINAAVATIDMELVKKLRSFTP